MKKTLLAFLLFYCITADAQQTSGTVVYQSVSTFKRPQGMREMRQNDDDSKLDERTMKSNYTLKFANGKSIWEKTQEALSADDDGDRGGRRMGMMAFSNAVIYKDFDQGISVEYQELFDKKYLITDSLVKSKWKITGETDTILGHPCMKAIKENIFERRDMKFENGKMEMNVVQDTSTLDAWFALDILAPTGPDNYDGLPGLILYLNPNDGVTVYSAVSISSEVKEADIKEPTKGKKVTRAEFQTIRSDMMKKMRENMKYMHPPGGGRGPR